MGEVIPFPTIDKQSIAEELTDEISMELITLIERKGLRLDTPDFCYDMAWVVKFLEILVKNQHGIKTQLGEDIKRFKPQDLYEKEQ